MTVLRIITIIITVVRMIMVMMIMQTVIVMIKIEITKNLVNNSHSNKSSKNNGAAFSPFSRSWDICQDQHVGDKQPQHALQSRLLGQTARTKENQGCLVGMVLFSRFRV